LLEDLKSIRHQLIQGVKDDTLPGEVEKERQATLVAGSIILEEVMAALNIQSLRVCPSALREGIVFDRIETSGRLPLQPIRASSSSMAKRFNLNQGQIQRVSTTAEHIFNAYAEALQLNEEAHRLLLAACQLHEIGLTISHKKIHLHGGYIIEHSNLTGITQRQQQMLAAMVRFHRKTKPSPKDAVFKVMRSSDVDTTISLAAILRLAAALNRTKGSTTAIPTIVERKTAWHWFFEQDWYEQHEVCVWNANHEKLPLSKLLGKAILLKPAKPSKK